MRLPETFFKFMIIINLRCEVAHSNCKYLRIIEMHDYHESQTVLTINDNHEFKGENVLGYYIQKR